MNNLHTLVAALSLAISCYSYAAGGEAGNEKLTRDGRPVSTDVKQCDQPIKGKAFMAEMYQRKQFADFFDSIRLIYPPIYLHAMNLIEDTVICETNRPINEVWKDTETKEKRLARWEPNGEGRKNLLLIDSKEFFSNPNNTDVNPKIDDAKRAATILRELLHAQFPAAQNKADADKIEWMKHQLIYDLHQDFVAGNLVSQREKYVRKMYDYGIIDLIDLYTGVLPACLSSVTDCQNTFTALDIIESPANMQTLTVQLATERMSLPTDSLSFVLHRLAAQPLTIANAGLDKIVTDMMSSQSAHIKTAAGFAQLHDVLAESGLLSPSILASYTNTVIRCASDIYAQGNCEFSFVIEGSPNHEEAKAVMNYLRSIQAPIQNYKTDVLIMRGDGAKILEKLRFLKSEGLPLATVVSLDNSLAVWIHTDPAFANIGDFRSFVDEFPELFSNTLAGFMFIYTRSGDKNEALKFGYLVEKGLVTSNLSGIVGPNLRQTLRQYPETKKLANRLK
jgi:hypothetical protein